MSEPDDGGHVVELYIANRGGNSVASLDTVSAPDAGAVHRYHRSLLIGPADGQPLDE
jgi:hypothetical protein